MMTAPPRSACDWTRDGLFVGHPRCAGGGLDAVLASEAIDDDLEVTLTGAMDDDLTARPIGRDARSRIFSDQRVKAAGQLAPVVIGVRLECEREQCRLVHVTSSLVAPATAPICASEETGQRPR